MKRARGLAITALILGSVAFLVGLVPFLGVVIAIPAIAFGIVGLIKGQQKAMSVIGLTLGSIALLVSAVMTFTFLVTPPEVLNRGNCF